MWYANIKVNFLRPEMARIVSDRSHLSATGATRLTLVLVHPTPLLTGWSEDTALEPGGGRKRGDEFQKRQGCLWWGVTVNPQNGVGSRLPRRKVQHLQVVSLPSPPAGRLSLSHSCPSVPMLLSGAWF